MPDKYFRLIAKYALILATFLGIEYIYSNYLIDKIIDIKEDPTLRATSTIGLRILLNIVMAILINLDIKRLKIKTEYLTIVTILSKHVGVLAFLLYVVYHKDKLDKTN
jgi:hypothetical protein